MMMVQRNASNPNLTFDSYGFPELDGSTTVLIGINVREKSGTTYIFADNVTLKKIHITLGLSVNVDKRTHNFSKPY